MSSKFSHSSATRLSSRSCPTKSQVSRPYVVSADRAKFYLVHSNLLTAILAVYLSHQGLVRPPSLPPLPRPNSPLDDPADSHSYASRSHPDRPSRATPLQRECQRGLAFVCP